METALTSVFSPTRHNLNTPHCQSGQYQAQPGTNEVNISQQAYAQYQQSVSRSASIEITTQDGDHVVIELSTVQAEAHSLYAARSSDQNSTSIIEARTSSNYTSVNYKLSIEGKLDKGEQKAIHDLVRRISKAADKLYDGDLQKAVDKASRIKFDSNEIQSYAFDITQVRQQQAVIAYQQTAQLEVPVIVKTNESTTIPEDLNNQLDLLFSRQSRKHLQAFLNTFFRNESGTSDDRSAHRRRHHS